MRLSLGSVNVLASNWLIFVARGGVALLLALGIAATGHGLYAGGFVGALGLFAIADGVFAGITWLRDRRFAQFSVEAVTQTWLGFVCLLWLRNASALLIWFALRAMAVEAIRAWTIRDTLPAKARRLPLVGNGLSAATGLGFLIISAFGYDALDLYACIAGNLAISGATLVIYGAKLHRLHPQARLRFTRQDSGHADHARQH